MALVNQSKISFDRIKLTPQYLLEVIALIESGRLSGKMAKEVVACVFESGDSPSSVCDRLGFNQISNEGELKSAIQAVLDQHDDVVAKIRNGKASAMGFLVGQVMKSTKGQAKPDLVKKLISDHFSEN